MLLNLGIHYYSPLKKTLVILIVDLSPVLLGEHTPNLTKLLELDTKLGQFPLFNFLGPGAGITSCKWINDATRYVMHTRKPTLTTDLPDTSGL